MARDPAARSPPSGGGAAPTERLALTALRAYLDDWHVDARGVGFGDELALALDLALRHGQAELVSGWLVRHGHRLHREDFLLETCLCLPAIASSICGGALQPTLGLSRAELASSLGRIEAALATSMGRAPRPNATPSGQRRTVSCDYSMVMLEPETLSACEENQMYFQHPQESTQGMSLFPTKVAIGTPADTLLVHVEVSAQTDGKTAAEVDNAVHAVAFPLVVRGPLRLRSVGSNDDDDPLHVPSGRYDVSARFVPMSARGRTAGTSLRVFRLLLTFHPDGCLEAPRCYVLEDGSPPPETIFANRSAGRS